MVSGVLLSRAAGCFGTLLRVSAHRSYLRVGFLMTVVFSIPPAVSMIGTCIIEGNV